MLEYYAFLGPEDPEEGYPPDEVVALREVLVQAGTAHKVRRMPK